MTDDKKNTLGGHGGRGTTCGCFIGADNMMKMQVGEGKNGTTGRGKGHQRRGTSSEEVREGADAIGFEGSGHEFAMDQTADALGAMGVKEK